MPPDGTAIIAAREIYPNCMAFDAGRKYIYAARTALTDVVRFPVLGLGRPGPAEAFGPPLGQRSKHEVGDRYRRIASDPVRAFRWALADGVAFDSCGNLWVTLVMANSIVAITPEQQVLPVVSRMPRMHLRGQPACVGQVRTSKTSISEASPHPTY